MTLRELWKKNFPKRFKYIISARGLKQKDVAKMLNMVPSSLSKYANGDIVPGALIILEMARVLKVPTSFLLHDYPLSKIATYLENQEKGKK